MVNFFTESEVSILFVVFKGKQEELTISLEPLVSSKKGLAIAKKHKVAITNENAKDELFYEDVPKDVLDYASSLFQEILLPMIQNSKNQKNWPKVVSQDVNRHFHRFSGVLSLFVGQTKGSTILPVPPVQDEAATDKSKAENEDKNYLHTLESAIIDWTREVKVLFFSKKYATHIL